jgi:hypothetical protein
MRVNLDEISKEIFTIDHAIGFFPRIIFTHRHPLLASMFNNILKASSIPLY